MKIVVENTIRVRFGDLKKGDCFKSLYTGFYHMKIDERNKGVNLESGDKYTWSDDDEVIPISAELRVKERNE